MNRDFFERLLVEAREAGIDLGWSEDDEPETEDGMEFGSPEAVLTTAVDVAGYLDQKRRSIRCHASQVTDSSFFLQMPDEAFARAFGTEWYIRRGAPAGIRDHELVLPAEG